jgi:hypothetical protein
MNYLLLHSEIRDSMQKRNIKDGKYFNRELRRKIIAFGLRKTGYAQKNFFNKNKISFVS